MAQTLYHFWTEEQGQDLIEYTLLMTFIVLAVFAFLGTGRPMVNAIWTTANSQLVGANTVAGGS
ncbi:MAG: Flp family type IVb pilin [Terriglobia bacterium]|nr:MAG: Flp family type IVb pilin [Terriglobia bacterium]